MRYYDLVANWSKIEPFVNHPKVQEAIRDNYGRYTLTYLGIPFENMTLEELYELRLRTEFGENWKQDGYDSRKGERHPSWVLCAPNTCHWAANVALELAKLVEPDRPWRFLSGKLHSTVWDGGDTLFDLNYFFTGVDPQECFERAGKSDGDKEMPIGALHHSGEPNPWWVPEDFDVQRRKEWNLQAIAQDAQRYLNNITTTLKAGKGGDDADVLAVLYEMTWQFVEAVRQKRRVHSAELLARFANFNASGAGKSLEAKVERTVDAVLAKVNRPGNYIAVARTQFLRDRLVKDEFEITESGVRNVHKEDDESPIDTLRDSIKYAALFRWDLCLFVQKGEESHSFWTFERFKAFEWNRRRSWS